MAFHPSERERTLARRQARFLLLLSMMSHQAFFGATDLVSDFSSFVAASRGISRAEADALIENWLKDYRPRTEAPSAWHAREPVPGQPCSRALALD